MQYLSTFSAMFLYAIVAGEVGNSSSRDLPLSQHIPTNGSKGTDPKKGICMSLAIPLTPPSTGGKIFESLLHLGQTKAHIFSIIPITGTPTFLQKFTSFRTSNKATSCGVVTITAPSICA